MIDSESDRASDTDSMGESTSTGDRDLLIFTVAGVQRFLFKARSTADLAAGSALMSELATAALAVVEGDVGAEVVMPSTIGQMTGVPNRIVARAPAGSGADLGTAMAAAVQARWDALVESVLGPNWTTPGTFGGFPGTQWVAVPADSGDYPGQWEIASRAMVARKRVRDFIPVLAEQSRICALTARWAAVPDESRPTGYNLRANEPLSVAGHVKRAHVRSNRERFPSTWSVASAPFRSGVIQRGEEHAELWGAVVDLHSAVGELRERYQGRQRQSLDRAGGALPGMASHSDEALSWLRTLEGAWCAPQTWEPRSLRRDHDLKADPDPELCSAGAKAAAQLGRVAREAGQPVAVGEAAR